jgi:transcriptional regulator with XRE-family HTH domain
MTDLSDWRGRLRDAINRTGKKHSVIAWEAGVTRATLSRVLTGKHAQPKFETILRIAHAAGENIGYLAGEQGFGLSSDERAKIQTAAVILINLTRGDADLLTSLRAIASRTKRRTRP